MLVAKFNCPSCAATLKPTHPVPAGKTVKCPKCTKPFEVPAEEVATTPQIDGQAQTRPLPRPVIPSGDSATGTVVPTSDSAAGTTTPDKTRPLPRPTLPPKETANGTALVSKIKCPSCSVSLKPSNPIPAGKSIKCPKCSHPFEVQAEEESEAEPEREESTQDTPAATAEAEPPLLDKFNCPFCKATLKPGKPMPKGKSIKCPKCSKPFAVGDEEPPAAEEKSEDGSADYEVVDDEEETPKLVNQTACPSCKATLKPAKPVPVGKKLKCPKCQLLFAVPAPEEDDALEADLVDDDEPAETSAKEKAASSGSPFDFDYGEEPAPRKAKTKDSAVTTKPKPAAKKKSRPVDDEDDEDRPRRKSMMGVYVTISCGVIGICVLAVGGYFLVKLIPSLGLFSSGDWVEVRPGGSRFTAMMPKMPVLEHEAKPLTAYVHDVGSEGYFIGYVDLPSKSANLQARDLTAVFRQGILQTKPNAKIESQKDIMLGKYQGHESIVQYDEGMLIMRMYVVPGKENVRLFVVMYGSKAEIDPDKGNAQKFFASFSILPEEDSSILASNKEKGPRPTSKKGKTTKKGPDPKLPPPPPPVAKERLTLRGHTAPVTAIAFSPDGSLIATGSEDKTVRVWDVATGAERGTFKLVPGTSVGHAGTIRSLCFSPNGQLLASGSEDKTAMVWNVEKQSNYRIIKKHTGPVNAVLFTPNGLVTGSADKTVHVWDVIIDIELFALEEMPAPVTGMAISGNGERLVMACANNSLQIWNLKTKNKFTSFTDQSSVNDFGMSIDGKTLASVAGDKTLKVWDVNSARHKRFSQGKEQLNGVAITRDGRIVATGGMDRIIRVWDIVKEEELGQFPGHKGAINALAFTPDGKQMASGSSDNMVKLWDIKLPEGK